MSKLKNKCQKNRSIPQVRTNAGKYIRKKERIIRYVYGYSLEDNPWTNNGRERHRLSKGKIHCSCPLCTAKTNRRHGGPSGWKANDQRKLAKGWERDDA